MRSLLRIRRLQIAGAFSGLPPRPPLLSPRPTALSFPPICIAGPSSRPFSLHTPQSSSSSSPEAVTYFTSSRPSPPHLVSSTQLLQSEDESESLRNLYVLMDRPSRLRNDWNSRKIFDTYRSLSSFARQQLPQDLVRKVLRNVVPSAQNLDWGVPGRPSRDIRHAKAWEERLKFVMGDIINWRGSVNVIRGEEPVFEDRGEYQFALARLSRLGRIDAVESIADEMRSRGIISANRAAGKHEYEIPIHEFRLLAIRNRLAFLSRRLRPSYAKHRQIYSRALDTTLPVFWNIIHDLRKDGLVPRQLTCTVLVQIISNIWDRIPADHPQSAHLHDLFEEILMKGYGLNLEYMTVNKTESKAEIKAFVIRAIVDHFGRKRDVWKMLSAFEVLTQTSGAEAHYQNTWNAEDQDDMGPTLAQMEAKEKEERQGMSMWRDSPKKNPIIVSSPSKRSNNHVEETTRRTPFTYADFLPSSTLSPFAVFALDAESLATLAEKFNPLDLTLNRTDLITTMLKHACAVNDYSLAHHILRMAIRDTQDMRSSWLARLVSRSRMHFDDAKAGTALYTGIRNLRTPNLAFDADWFLSIRPLIFGTLRTAVGEPHVSEGPASSFFKLMEDAETWIEEEMAILQGAIRPLTHDSPPHLQNPAATSEAGTSTVSSTAPIPEKVHTPLIGEIYRLENHRASAQNTLDRLRSIHLEAIQARQTQVSKKRRQRLTWLGNKIRARQEAEAESMRIAERKAADKAEKRRAQRGPVREEDVGREEGMMLSTPAAAVVA